MINLLPPALKQNRLYGRHNVSLFGYSAALLGTALLTAGIIYVGLQFIGSEEPQLREEIATAQTEIGALEGRIKDVEAVAARLETAQKISQQSVSFSELLPRIGAVLPDGVILNALSLTGGNTDPLQFDVDMREANLASVMVKNLVESQLFEAADISSLTPKGIEAGDTAEYQFTASITASFTGTAEAKRKADAAAAAAAAAAAQQQATEESE